MESTTALPSGTVTFLFTDIEGSTRLWEQHPGAMRAALARHDALLRTVLQSHGGHVFKSMGDQFCAAFATAPETVAAALAAQQALGSEPWGEVGPVRVRMAIHTGAVELREGDYFGPPLNRVARLLGVGHGGQILLSQAAADLVRGALPEAASLSDLGAHRLKDLQQPEHLFQLVTSDLPREFPPLRSLEAFAHNLPRQLTSFIGREQEMAEVKRLFAATPLLTLTGAGGCGKTRLALQVAADLVDEFGDGVWLVELAALTDPALVPQTVAAALGVWEEPGRPLTATLADYLRPKSLLLVLDNCEHLLSACAQLADTLLRACQRLCLLASSREGLGIAGETTYRVPSLSLPDLRHLPPVGANLVFALCQYEAARLFADRAVAALPSFTVTPQNAPALAQVCQRLDGIPLAIELAAARVKALSVEKLNERLEDMFRLLTGGSRAALPRLQTLRALIDWSYDLLSPEEKMLLRRLSVFAGGWTLEAAEKVCAGEGVEEWEVLDLLTSLVEKSLVLYEEWGGEEARYRLLETVRQYARDRLLETGEVAAVRGRHRDWFLALAEQAEEGSRGASQTTRLERLERDHGNLRAALAWVGVQGEGEAGLRLGGALWRFWQVRGYWTEGRQHLAGLLALPSAEAHTAVRAKALHGAAWLAYHQHDLQAVQALCEEALAISRELSNKQGIADSLCGLGWAAKANRNHGAARALLEESLAIFRELGDKPRLALSLIGLGRTAHEKGDHGAARGPLEESLTISRQLDDKPSIAWSLNSLGNVASAQGEHGAAWTHFEESLEIFRELGHKLGIAASLHGLGRTTHGQGKYEVARAFLEASLAIWRELDNKVHIASLLSCLGMTTLAQGEYRTARTLYNESLAILRQLGDKETTMQVMDGLAAVAVAQGQPERAARLLGAAEALREAMGAPLPPADRAEHDRSVTAARTALGDEAFAAAWAEGRAMSLDQAIHCALEAGGGEGRVPA